MERILPFGRMLAVPPPFRETVLPGGVRPAEVLPAEAGLPVVAPGLAVVRVVAVFPGFPAGVPGLDAVAVRVAAVGLAVVPVLVVAPGLLTVPDRWPVVAL
jgi:hypothetical protein